MNIERTEAKQGDSYIIRLKLAPDKRIDVRMYPVSGVYGKATISPPTTTLEAEEVPQFIAALAMAQAEAVRLETLYMGKQP